MANDAAYIRDVYFRLLDGIQDFYQSDHWQNFLSVMGRFHHYTLTNCMMIYKQMPEATRVAGYNDWKKNFNRQVRKGEKGIQIAAPFTGTRDVETNERDENGNRIIRKENYIYFRPVYVFDISQTDGEPLPKLVSNLTGDVQEFQVMFRALERMTPYAVIYDDLPGDKNGECDFVNRIISIQEGMSELQTIKTLIHEVVHSRLHNPDMYTDRDLRKIEIEAESAAFIICDYFGLDTSDYSFGYVAGWAAGEDKADLRSVISMIKKEAVELIKEMEPLLEETRAEKKNLEEAVHEQAEGILKEQGIEAEIKGVYVYSAREAVSDEPQEIHMYVFNPDRSYEADFVVSSGKEAVLQLLQKQEPYEYLDQYLLTNGIACTVNPVTPDTVYSLSYDYTTYTVSDLTSAAISDVSAMVEIKSDTPEEEVFAALNDAAPQISNLTVHMNTVKDEGISGLSENYIERLDVYESLGYNDRWPMVAICYTNIDQLPLASMNIHEAVLAFKNLPESVINNPRKYAKIKLSYCFKDWDYEIVSDVDMGNGGMNFIDYLNLPSNVISHLKSHDSLLSMCSLASDFAPGTSYGSAYVDDMQEWAEYCRMELNHNSDSPVIPRPPEINAAYFETNKDWRVER